MREKFIFGLAITAAIVLGPSQHTQATVLSESQYKPTAEQQTLAQTETEAEHCNDVYYTYDREAWLNGIKIQALTQVAIDDMEQTMSHLNYQLYQTEMSWRNYQMNARYLQLMETAMSENARINTEAVISMDQRVYDMLYTCAAAQKALDINKQPLLLYCQQFAFSRDNTFACSQLLSCVDTQLPYKYSFPDSYQL